MMTGDNRGLYNNVSILHHFLDTTTLSVYVTACEDEKCPSISIP